MTATPETGADLFPAGTVEPDYVLDEALDTDVAGAFDAVSDTDREHWMRARRFDLAVQVHGGGRYSNPFLLRLGARHTVGTRTPDAAELERTLGPAPAGTLRRRPAPGWPWA